MTDLALTPGRNPILFCRDVDTFPETPEDVISVGGFAIQAVRFTTSLTQPEHLFTAGGNPILIVRDVDEVTTVPEVLFTPGRNPILPVRLYEHLGSPEQLFTPNHMPIQAIRLYDAVGNPTTRSQSDVDAQGWAAKVVTNGGTVSTAQLALVSTFITAEKAAGTWPLTDDYWVWWAENLPQAMTSLKQQRLATLVGAPLPVLVAGKGLTTDGAQNYVNLQYVGASHAVAMTGTDHRLATYERTNTNLQTYAIGATQGTPQNMTIRPRASSSLTASLNGPQGNFALADSLGYSAVSRAGGGLVLHAYRNGVRLAPDVTVGSAGTALLTIPLFAGANNSSGSPISFRATNTGLQCVGAPLSDAQELAQYNNVQAFATALGANV